MARSFGIVYPSKDRIILNAGLNTKVSRANLLDEESPQMLNVVYSEGTIGTRGGTSKLNTTAIGSFPIDGLFTRRETDGTETMVAFGNGTGYTLGGTTFTVIASALSVYTAGTRVGGTQYQEQLFVGNGTTPYKWTGADFTRHGIYAPNSGPTAGSAASGVLTGDYRYKVTYVNSFLVESDTGSSTATLTVASATIGLTDIPTAPVSFGVAARRIYRTETSGITWKRVAELANNTTTVYSDNTADSGLGVAAPTDQGVPPTWSVAIYHQSRLFVNDTANPGYVWYSEIGEPHLFPSTNFFRIGDASSDVVKSLSVYQNSVLVICETSMWLIYMPSSDPLDWSQIRTKSAYGTLSPQGAVVANNAVIVPVTQSGKFSGFAKVIGDAIAPDVTLTTAGAVGSELESQRIEPEMFEVKEGSVLSNIVGVAWKNKVWFSVPSGNTATTNNKVFIYDFSYDQLVKSKKPAWFPCSGFNPNCWTIYGGNIYYGDALSTGSIFRADTDTYNDNGAAIDSYVWTKEFSGYQGHESIIKDFRQLNLLAENTGAWFMSVGWRVDSDASVGNTQQLYLDQNSSTWGSLVFGTSVWGGGSDQTDSKIFLGTAKGQRIQFKFSNMNTVNQNFMVHNLSFSYNLRGDR